MKLEIEVTGVTLLLTNGPDKLIIDTNLPCTYVIEALPSQPNAELHLDCTYDTGLEYCERILGITPETINTR